MRGGLPRRNEARRSARRLSAVDRHMAGKQAFAASHDPAVFARHRQRFAGGAGSYPLVGTPAPAAALPAETVPAEPAPAPAKPRPFTAPEISPAKG